MATSFAVNIDTCIGYNGENPVSLDEDTIVIPSAAGGLTSVQIDSGTSEWWTPCDGSRQLSCVVRNPSGNTFAVGERRLKATIHIISHQRRILQTIKDVAKLQIIDMAYSRDGSRFVCLADAPAHTFTIFHVVADRETLQLPALRKSELTPGAYSEHQYTFISFNPRSPSDMCTSGGGHLTLWKHDESSSNPLVPLEGRVTRPNVRITCHEWSIVPGASVAAGTTSGLLLSFNISSGVGEIGYDCSEDEVAGFSSTNLSVSARSTSSEAGAGATTTNSNSIVGLKVTKHHTVILTEDGTLRFLACISHVNPHLIGHQQQQQHGGNQLLLNASFGGGNQSMAINNASMTLGHTQGMSNLSFTNAAAAATSASMSPSMSFGSIPPSNAALANLNSNIYTGVPTYQLQRVIRVPLIERASCLSMCLDWKTLLVGCKARGTLTAVSIEGYESADVDASTFAEMESSYRVICSGVRGPMVGSAFVEQGEYCCILDSSSILRLCHVESRREEFRTHVGEKPSAIASSSVLPIVITGSENGTIRCYSCVYPNTSNNDDAAAASASSPTEEENNNNNNNNEDNTNNNNNNNNVIDTATLRLIMSDKVSSSPIRMIIPHPTLPLAIVVAGDSTLIFLPLSDPVRIYGVAEMPNSYEGVGSLSWTHDETSPQFVFTANNSTLVLCRYPQDPIMTENLTYPNEDIIVNSWRTELPMTVASVMLTTEGAIFGFGGGVDKESKFFTLDRNASAERKDRESKAIKLPLAFRDHEKPLVAIKLIGGNKLLTVGSDGRIIIRDISCLLTGTPNIREIRKDAIAVAPKHASLLGGIRNVSISADSKHMITCGHDGVALLWSMGSATELASHHQKQIADRQNHLLVSPETNFWHIGPVEDYPLMVPISPAEEEQMDFRDKRRKLALDFDRHHAAAEHEKIKKHVTNLQDKLRQVFVENEKAAEDEKVDLLDFVVTNERKEFSDVCEKNIEEMKHTVKMEDLRCDYTAEFLRKTRWDTMKNQLTVLEGLVKDEDEEHVKVHNFSVPHDNQEENDILRKVKFMRRMQERMKFVAAKKAQAAAQQYALEAAQAAAAEQGGMMMDEQVVVAPTGAFGGGFMNLAGGAGGSGTTQQQQAQAEAAAQQQAYAASQQQGGGGGGGSQSNNSPKKAGGEGGDENVTTPRTLAAQEKAEAEKNLPLILKSESMSSVTNHLTDVTPFLFAARDTFARVRAMMQSKLLRARVHALRVAFNEKFASLVNDKKSIMTQASERTSKCKVIQLQLADHRKLVECFLSTIENPDVVLTVGDDEVQEDRTHDPAYKRKKQKEEDEAERWRRVHGNDDGPERALKAWMDGRLDKEVLEIIAKLEAPDFADEKSNKFVPEEDRSDEQNKIYREYEKKLEKLVADVAEQRRKLEMSLKEMQKATQDSIVKFDAAVKSLFYERVRVSQFCSEAELSRVKLSFNFMEYAQTEAELSIKEQHRVELQNKLISASEATRRFRQKLENKRQSVAQLKNDEQARDRNMKSTPPFSTSEELTRWWNQQQQKRKRGGRARIGLDAKKHAKAAAAAKANAGPSGPISPDPWEFLEREASETAEARRQEESIIHANGAAAQYPDRPEFINEHVWQDFLDFVDDKAAKERQVKKMHEEINEMTQEDGRLTAVEDELRSMAEDSQQQRDLKQRRLIEQLFDVDQLLVFRQGHVEYEQDPFITEYGDAVLIHTARVQDLNGDIKERGKIKVNRMKEEAARVRELRQIDWETRHSDCKAEILKLECNQLGTLRVTKQMQEFISGGGEDHNERQRAKLCEKIEHVRKTMTQRIDDKKTQMGKVKRHTRERELENMMLTEQVNHADALLQTRRHVHTLHAVDTDAELPQRMMRDMRVTRRLEDVARAQNEEMGALKLEVDRLRERTFPSFAVVSKRVIGNSLAPDAKALSTRS